MKLRAIENLYTNGVDIIPVITIINGINNEQVGRIVQFALDNPKRIPFLSFQPVSFTGRDEAVTDERRAAQRYTLSHLAHDVKNQTGLGEPARDWFPISFMSTFSDWSDLVHGPQADWGQLSCGCHPNCGVGMAVMVDKETKEAGPVTAFLNADRLASDVARVNDAARGKWLSIVGMALAVARNYDPFQSPTHFKLLDMLKKFDKTFGATGKNYGKVGKDRTMDDIEKRRARSLELPVHRRHVVPGSVQLRFPPHRAVHHSVRHAGRRDFLLRLQHRRRLAQHHREDAHDRDADQVVRGARQARDLRRRQERAAESKDHSLVLREDIVTNEVQHDLDRLGIAKTAREEKIRARDAKMKEQAENERMVKLYREHVLKEQPGPDLVQIGGIAPAPGRLPSPLRRSKSAKKSAASATNRP